jgi:hypothetical protein
MAFNQKYQRGLAAKPATRAIFRRPGRQFLLLGFVAAAAIFSPASESLAAADPQSSTAQWMPVLYDYKDLADASGDQQNGGAELDIVGTTSQSALYLQCQDGGQADATAGSLGFRLRLGADQCPVGYNFAAFVGLDANLDGKLDLFIGVNNLGCADYIGIWSPGAGRNNSPKTTTLASQRLYHYGETPANYELTPVSPATDPSAQSSDLNRDHRTDQFLSFFVPLADVVSALDALGFDSFTASSPVALLAATATQANRLDGDLAGVYGGTNSRQTWTQLGALSQICTFDSFAPIPEPSPAALSALAGGLALFLLFKRRSRV